MGVNVGPLSLFGLPVTELQSSCEPPKPEDEDAPPVQPETAPKAVAELRSALLAKQGNLLRAWRIYFDLDGDLGCTFRELCAGCVACNFKGDVAELVDHSGGPAFTFSRVAPALCKLLEKFRMWVQTSFDGPGEMFEAFDTDGGGFLSFEEFKAALERAGWIASVPGTTLQELFDGFDLDNEGGISKDEVAIAEQDENERRTWMRQIRHEKEQCLQRELAKLADSSCGPHDAKPGHRLADRAWLLDQLPKVPRLEANRRKEREEMEDKQKANCLIQFHQHLVATYGCVVRAWRRVLDPRATFRVSRAQILQYCRSIDFSGNSKQLWAALDQNRDGIVRLEELDPSTCDSLAFLANWAQTEFGGCARLWDILAHENKGNADRRLKPGALAFALDAVGYPHASDSNHMRLLTMGLDYDGCGFIGPSDLSWLESWVKPPWLGAEPDYEGLEQLKRMLVKKYGHIVKAWRILIDKRSENRVTWQAFFNACWHVQYHRRFSGIWRALDDNLDGWVTLQELDAPSHEMILSFKLWIDKHFGSSQIALSSIDGDGSGEVTLSELKRACRRLHWEGDVTVLFCCLDSEPYPTGLDANQIALLKRHVGLHLKNLSFLDSYRCEAPDFSGRVPVHNQKSVAGASAVMASPDGFYPPPSQPGSHPASRGGSRPVSQGGSRPVSQGGSRPVSQGRFRIIAQGDTSVPGKGTHGRQMPPLTRASSAGALRRRPLHKPVGSCW